MDGLHGIQGSSSDHDLLPVPDEKLPPAQLQWNVRQADQTEAPDRSVQKNRGKGNAVQLKEGVPALLERHAVCGRP